MTEEVVEQQQEVIEQAQDDSGFAAGFAEVRGEEPPVSEPVVEEQASSEEVQQQAEAPAAETQQDDTPEQNLIAGLTDEQLRGVLAKANMVDDLVLRIEKTHGKIGELNRTIQNLQQKNGTAQLSAGQLKRLSSEYPELATLLAEDLSEALAGSGGGQAQQFDQSVLDARVAEQVSSVERKFEKKLVLRDHPDFDQVCQSDDFRLWLKTVLPPEESARLNSAWESEYISGQITAFKTWRAAAAESAEKTRESRNKRLESAVAPTGSRSVTPNQPSEDEAFSSGFNQVRNSRLY